MRQRISGLSAMGEERTSAKATKIDVLDPKRKLNA
jgi:hypothetical protein